jgi:hypothetical protein
VLTTRVAHYLQGVKVPKELKNSKLFQKYDDVSNDLFFLPNEIFSYALERRENSHDSNLISILMQTGKFKDLQEAFDETFNITKKFFEDLMATKKEILNEFGETEEILKVFDAFEQVVVGSIEWHLNTPRYSGKENLFRETLIMEIEV